MYLSGVALQSELCLLFRRAIDQESLVCYAKLVLVRKYLLFLVLILLFGIFWPVSYFYFPSSVKILDEKAAQSNPKVLNKERLALVKDYGDFLEKGLPENNPLLYFYWFSNQRKISDLRVKRAVEEIKNTNVEAGKIKVWSLLNMGAVVKTNKHTIAFDIANLFFSSAHNDLADVADIFLVTHGDRDHFDSGFLKKAVENNKKIIFPKGFGFGSSKPENLFFISSGQTINIDGVKITAYQTDHRGDGNFSEPGAWFVVEVDGFKLLHTGDGRDFKNKNEQEKVYSMKNIDILLGNNTLHSYNIRDLNPKVYIPMHLYKFMSGGDLYRESRIENVLSTHQQYEKELKGIEKLYLLPGESVLLP